MLRDSWRLYEERLPDRSLSEELLSQKRIDNPPFFIVGSGRSGTTLLRLMIAGHSRIHIPPETWFLQSLVQRFPLTQALTEEQVAQAISVITSHYRWPDMKMEARDFREQAEALCNPKLAELINIIYRHQLTLACKQRIGDKTPFYIGIVRELSVLYPGAKFIHLIRDGRDVAISYADAGWGKVYHGSKFEWINAVREAERCKRELGEAMLDIRYEELVLRPEQTLRQICAFLGERFEEGMLSYSSRLNLVAERDRHLHSKLGMRLNADAVARWRRQLSPIECFIIEACLRPELVALGYTLRFKAPAWRPLMAIAAAILRSSAPLLDRLVPALQRKRLLTQYC